MNRLGRWTAPLLGVATFFGLWELLLVLLNVKPFVLPRPSHTIAAISHDLSFFAKEAAITGAEALAGLLIALVIAVALAVPMARWRAVERAVQPVATLIQVVPIVCFAPAFVIWMSPGTFPIVSVAALISLVPLLFTLVLGLKSADPAVIELLRSVGASRWEILRSVEGPGALRSVLAGSRIAVGLALVGAVLGEPFALRSHGLGVQIYKGLNGGATLIWSCAFVLGLMGGLAMLALAGLERLLPGRQH
jgi:NitT/TauT family transport system permease protein